MAVSARNDAGNHRDLSSPGNIGGTGTIATGAPDSRHDPAGPALLKTHLEAAKAALEHLSTATASRNAAAKDLKKTIKSHKSAHKALAKLMAKAAAPSGDKQSALALMLSTADKVYKAHKSYRAAAKLHKTSADQTQAQITESILGLAKLAGGGAEVAFSPSVSTAAGSDREKGSQGFSEIGFSSRKAQALAELTKIAKQVVDEHLSKNTKMAPRESSTGTTGVGDRSQKVPFTKAEDNGTASGVTDDALAMTAEDWAAYRRGEAKAIHKAQAATSRKWAPVPQRILERGARGQ